MAGSGASGGRVAGGAHSRDPISLIAQITYESLHYFFIIFAYFANDRFGFLHLMESGPGLACGAFRPAFRGHSVEVSWRPG